MAQAPGKLRVLHRDDHLVIVDKPAGLAVHRGWAPERDVAMFRVRDALGVSVHPVHRLDRGTSGVLVFALDPAGARALGDAFAGGAVDKRYLALVRGVPPDAIRVDHPLPSEDAPDAARFPATTELRRLETFGRYSLVEARPLTGRLHQVRRHCKHLSCPLIGDVRYGKGEHNRLFRDRYGLDRLFLHAASITLPHPATGQPLRAEAPLPPELRRCLDALRADSGAPGQAPP